MGGVSSALSVGATYCFCSSASSLCNSCLGSTSPHTTGRKRSVLFLSIVITCSLLFRYYVALSILDHKGWWNTYRSLPGLGKRVYSSWASGCEDYQGDLFRQCVANSGVYRPTFLSTLFFAASAVATNINPSLNREAWPAKYSLFLFLLLATMLIPNHPIFDSFYLTLFRLGAMVFIVIQQIILIDMAYNWNESWVERANQWDAIDYGSGKVWLYAIIAMCVVLYSLSFIGIGFLYHFFDGCAENNAVLTLTWVGILIMSLVQLTGVHGSLLTSSVMSAYVTYLAYSIVSKNPNEVCNPQLGQEDPWGIGIGLCLTMLSLAWTGWSWTAEGRLNRKGLQATKSVLPTSSTRHDPESLNLDMPFLDPDEQPVSGVVMEHEAEDDTVEPTSSLWKLNIIMALVSCWVAASLTGWGSIQGRDDTEHHSTAANPLVGRLNMAMIGVSQWLAFILYGWTLLAPRLFPDRDFS